MTSLANTKFYKYAEDVINDKIVVGEFIRQAVERFYNDLDRKEFTFDYAAGERMTSFGEKFCRHWKGIYAGKPIDFLPHQHFYLINLFGWKRDDGTRRFRRSYKEIARKSAKTTESAIKGLFLTSKDGEAGAQVYAAATKEDQASIVCNDAGRIVENSPKLRGKFKMFYYKELVKRVVHPESSSFIKPLGKDSDRQDGLDPSCAIIDEYHAWMDDDLLNVLDSGMVMRKQPLVDIITTSGYNLMGPCFAFRRVCADVLSGEKKDDSLFTMIFALDEDDSWEDPEVWIKANPNMADPVLRDQIIMPYLQKRYNEAKNEGARKEVDFKTKNLNVWCDAPEVWIPSDVWGSNSHGNSIEQLNGRLCYGGLDLASGVDLNAFVLYFPEFAGKTNAILPFFWMPEEAVRNNRIRMDYSEWVKQGHIMTTPGNIIDHEVMTDFIIQEVQKYNFQVLGFDPKMAYHGTIQNLLNERIDCQPFSQGIMTITEPTKELERLAYGRQLEHFRNPILKWMMGNVALKQDAAGNYMIHKGASQGKIDGIAATINAIGTHQRFPPKESVYKSRGVVVL